MRDLVWENCHKIPTMRAINAYAQQSDFLGVSFFSGLGGASIGAKAAGINVRYANEFIDVAADTYEANSSITVDRSDIRKVTAKRVYRMSGIPQGAIDFMDLSPPCKAYSNATNSDLTGKTVLYSEGVHQQVDDLFDHGIRVLKQLQPKVFIAENVPGLVAKTHAKMFAATYRDFEGCGYNVQAVIIDPSYLGVPQVRKRLIFMGVRNDLAAKGFKPTWPKSYGNQSTLKEYFPYVHKVKLGGDREWGSPNRPMPTMQASMRAETARFGGGGWVEVASGTRLITIDEFRIISSVPQDFVFPEYEGEAPQKHQQRCWERLGRIHLPLQVYHLAKTIRKNILEPYRNQK